MSGDETIEQILYKIEDISIYTEYIAKNTANIQQGIIIITIVLAVSAFISMLFRN